MKKMTKSKISNVTKRFKVIGLTLVLSLLFGMPVMATEEADTVFVTKGNVVEGEEITLDSSSNLSEIMKNIPSDDGIATGKEGVMPLASGIYGYSAGHITSTVYSFRISATGSGTSRGGLSIKTHGFSSNQTEIEVTLRRPDNSVARTVILTGNTMVEDLSFSNAPAGNYTVVVTVAGSPGGYVSAWVFSM